MQTAHRLPPIQNHPAAWYGPAMARMEHEWLGRLTPTDIDELEHAAQAWVDPRRDLAALTAGQFALPTLRGKLLSLRGELLHGRGFAVLRGLPVERYNERETAVIFCGLGCHIGLARTQNAQGQLLGHVRDLGLSSQDPNVRVYQTSERQTFHTGSARRRSRRWTASTSWPTARNSTSRCAWSRATCSLSTTMPCCTIAPRSRTGRSSTASAICCACGLPFPATGPCRNVFPRVMARSRSATGVAS